MYITLVVVVDLYLVNQSFYMISTTRYMFTCVQLYSVQCTVHCTGSAGIYVRLTVHVCGTCAHTGMSIVRDKSFNTKGSW